MLRAECEHHEASECFCLFDHNILTAQQNSCYIQKFNKYLVAPLGLTIFQSQLLPAVFGIMEQQ